MRQRRRLIRTGRPSPCPIPPNLPATNRAGATRGTGSTDCQKFTAGDTIFEQDEPGDNLYVVRSGEVEILSNGVTVDVVGEGGIGFQDTPPGGRIAAKLGKFPKL